MNYSFSAASDDFMKARARRSARMSAHRSDTTVILKDRLGKYVYLRMPHHFGCSREALIANRQGILVYIGRNFSARDEAIVKGEIQAYESWFDRQL